MAEGTEEQLTEYVKKSKWIALQMDEFTDVQKNSFLCIQHGQSIQEENHDYKTKV